MHFCHQELQMILVAITALFPFLNFIVKPCCKHLLDKYHREHGKRINEEGRLLGKVEASFLCKCGKQGGWIVEGYTSTPCPKCGRVYRGVHDKDTGILKAVEV